MTKVVKENEPAQKSTVLRKTDNAFERFCSNIIDDKHYNDLVSLEEGDTPVMLDNKVTGDNNTFWTKVTDAFMDTDYAWNVAADTSFSGDEYNKDSDSDGVDDVSDKRKYVRVA
ncbi:hypothetical protein SARC_11081 [Sphaeroforma arctica JP610]|uniref:Uncharacterized protein n=1 Tax=Sphaeroforma arctica JP610 TaxID=667725 RepID=A0A0L0FI36_9EUKA|nr:hypothetical protein SARC_11081 [Sphaeroforma arctica JP610]KNC76420.1 hypothetical protein SARC_11081 [Sphaeroforma arctica JP610]|eukprot:XP_014150322.1 hypothetical protein SARC_11081 [Sphaeroforma arctica JP610]